MGVGLVCCDLVWLLGLDGLLFVWSFTLGFGFCFGLKLRLVCRVALFDCVY